MVLLVLAVIWAAVLIPPVIRARAEARPDRGIGHFRRQLQVLERTGPTTLAMAPVHSASGVARPRPAASHRNGPAYRAAPANGASPLTAPVHRAAPGARRGAAVAPRTAPAHGAGAGYRFGPVHAGAPVHRAASYAGAPAHRAYSPEAARRARTLKRRRDALFTLLSAMGVTLVLGLIPPLRVLLGLHLVLDLLFVGYVALLVRARNAAAEREMKLRFLPATARADNVLLLQRSAN